MNNDQKSERLTSNQLQTVLNQAQCLYHKSEVAKAYDKLAQQLNAYYVGLNPYVLVVMKGGMIPAGQLMTRLSFFHRMDYIHATRYKNNTEGDTSIEWLVKPKQSVRNEHVLVIDDIYDQGNTLRAIVQELEGLLVKSVKTCVLVNKIHERKLAQFYVDFTGLDVPDRFVFGCGMDYQGYLRHLDGVYAIDKSSL